MPPRLQLLRRAAVVLPGAQTYQPIAPFLYPVLQQQRSASILNALSDTDGAYNKRIRRGRGPSSGKGKTAGRGHKGQKAHGKVPMGMQGGQTPNWVVHGKTGFENKFSVEMSKLNLDQVQLWINKGRLDPSAPITIRELCNNHCLNGVQDGVKLLARGKEQLTTPIHIVVSRASEEAIKAVEDLGGSVTTRYYTKFAVDKIRKGEMNPLESIQSRIPLSIKRPLAPYPFRLPDPTSRKDLEYYRDSAKRGYLSHTVAKGHGPSLYFKAPGTVQRRVTAVSAKQRQAQKEASRLW